MIIIILGGKMCILYKGKDQFVCKAVCRQSSVWLLAWIETSFPFLILHLPHFALLQIKCWTDGWAPLPLNSVFNPHGGTSEALFPRPPLITFHPHLLLPPPHHQEESHRVDPGTNFAWRTLEDWTPGTVVSLFKEELGIHLNISTWYLIECVSEVENMSSHY